MRTERTGRPVTSIYMVLNYPIDVSRDEEFNKWYNEKHGPEGLAMGYMTPPAVIKLWTL